MQHIAYKSHSKFSFGINSIIYLQYLLFLTNLPCLLNHKKPLPTNAFKQANEKLTKPPKHFKKQNTSDRNSRPLKKPPLLQFRVCNFWIKYSGCLMINCKLCFIYNSVALPYATTWHAHKSSVFCLILKTPKSDGNDKRAYCFVPS